MEGLAVSGSSSFSPRSTEGLGVSEGSIFSPRRDSSESSLPPPPPVTPSSPKSASLPASPRARRAPLAPRTPRTARTARTARPQAATLPSILPSASAEYTVRRTELLERVSARGSSIAGLSYRDRSKREVALAAVKANGTSLQWVPEMFKKDKAFAMAAVQQNGLALQYVARELHRDRDLVKAAVEQNGLALSFASSEIAKDKEIVMMACSQNGTALQFASHDLRRDRGCRSAAGADKIDMDETITSTTSSRSRNSTFANTSIYMSDGRWPSCREWSPELSIKATHSLNLARQRPTRRELRQKRRGAFSGGGLFIDMRFADKDKYTVITS
eukprot:gb/GFBE01046562.1/.p1 GENE.gb/GFBE01046562.1/~~gb/GFBE01046562.1/.p1  ORF type:complete len:330 (+),score=43.68 gb/GFBE01046562.1/:1-990(+)